MFKKIPFWAFGLVVLTLLLVAFGFGVIVRDASFGHYRLGAVSRLAWNIASLPAEAARELRMLRQGNSAGMATLNSERFPGKSRWTFHEAGIKSGLDGYLLFSRYDGDVGNHVLELVDLKAGEVKYRIDLDAPKLLAGAEKKTWYADLENWARSRFQAIHPIALENGDFIVKGFFAPMFRMTPCGEVVWLHDDTILHHTTEIGPDGNFWSSSYIDPLTVEGLTGTYQDPGITEFNADGEILYDRSLTDVMLKHGLGYLFLPAQATFDTDPLHLNDVQPVFEDGPYWKKGDVFLSIRHLSMIMLFRPSADEIIWWKQGPWAAQHDVDVIDDSTIAVFNNNAYDFGKGLFVDGHSDITFYDFETNTTFSPHADALVREDFRNSAGGLFTILPDGHYYVDESESGRTMFFTPDGQLAAENVNRAENGLIFHLGWSRYMDRASGDQLLKSLEAADCAAAR